MEQLSLSRVEEALVCAPNMDEDTGCGRAAVAMILDSQLDVLFIVRAIQEGDPWSGHVGFPGGRRNDADLDLFQTAMRETHEEIGLDLSEARCLGILDEVRSPAAGPMAVVARPYVFLTPKVRGLTLNHEVADTIRVPLAALVAGKGRGQFVLDWRGAKVTLPCVDCGGQRLWGMTLRMVDDLLHRIDGQGRGFDRHALRWGESP
jgi:8-oxo-dGTP pyrophosphatase MutT (NUDIX family)